MAIDILVSEFLFSEGRRCGVNAPLPLVLVARQAGVEVPEQVGLLAGAGEALLGCLQLSQHLALLAAQ